MTFVFGSNRQGRHGKGAALKAVKSFGAIYGQPEGLQGESYAIITKELRPHYPAVKFEEVARGVVRFIKFARLHPEMVFLISPIGCGLAGFKYEQIAPLFVGAPSNCILPPEFERVLHELASRQ